jgi:hypothetical protein
MGHDEKDSRDYDLMHEISRDTYIIQGELQQEGNGAQFNSPGRGNFNPHGGFIGRGHKGGMGQDRGHIIFYNCTQPGNLEMDCQKPCTTCSYCNSFDHFIEYCPVLLAKLQERRSENQEFQLILVEPHSEEPRVIVITRVGIVTGEDRVAPGNTIYGSGIRKAVEKAQLFDPRK